MPSASWILSTFLSAGASLALTGPLIDPMAAAHAEELEMTNAPQSEANRPARGMTMQRVEATYGAPASRVPAVGNPPISRWEYPGFVVFFEHGHVIHTVAIG